MKDLPNVFKTRRSVFLLWMIALLLGAVYPNVGYLKKQFESSNGTFLQECGMVFNTKRFIQVGDDNKHIFVVQGEEIKESTTGMCGEYEYRRNMIPNPTRSYLFIQKEASQVIYYL
jgi:hypothetical protein